MSTNRQHDQHDQHHQHDQGDRQVNDPVIDLLDFEWGAIIQLARSLQPDQWDIPTALPGWTVRDNVSHIIGTERMLLGDPAPVVDVSHLDHIHDPFAASMETWVEARRGTPGPDLIAELTDVTNRRLEALRAMTPEELDKVGWSPIGEVPYRAFMGVRVFDCWMHEQDIRRAVGDPGHLDGPIVDVALERFENALGFIVGKKAAAPDGSSVTFVVNGPRMRRYAVVVDGRARVVDTAEEADGATVTLTMPLETFVALGGGRWDREQALAEGDVSIGGDDQLGEAVLGSMAFTP